MSIWLSKLKVLGSFRPQKTYQKSWLTLQSSILVYVDFSENWFFGQFFRFSYSALSNTYSKLTDLRSRKVSLRIHLILLEFINNNCNEVNPWKTWVGKLPILFMYNTLKWNNTVFENHRKSRIQHCERSELRLHQKWTVTGMYSGFGRSMSDRKRHKWM